MNHLDLQVGAPRATTGFDFMSGRMQPGLSSNDVLKAFELPVTASPAKPFAKKFEPFSKESPLSRQEPGRAGESSQTARNDASNRPVKERATRDESDAQTDPDTNSVANRPANEADNTDQSEGDDDESVTEVVLPSIFPLLVQQQIVQAPSANTPSAPLTAATGDTSTLEPGTVLDGEAGSLTDDRLVPIATGKPSATAAGNLTAAQVQPTAAQVQPAVTPLAADAKSETTQPAPQLPDVGEKGQLTPAMSSHTKSAVSTPSAQEIEAQSKAPAGDSSLKGLPKNTASIPGTVSETVDELAAKAGREDATTRLPKAPVAQQPQDSAVKSVVSAEETSGKQPLPAARPLPEGTVAASTSTEQTVVAENQLQKNAKGSAVADPAPRQEVKSDAAAKAQPEIKLPPEQRAQPQPSLSRQALLAESQGRSEAANFSAEGTTESAARPSQLAPQSSEIKLQNIDNQILANVKKAYGTSGAQVEAKMPTADPDSIFKPAQTKAAAPATPGRMSFAESVEARTSAQGGFSSGNNGSGQQSQSNGQQQSGMRNGNRDMHFDAYASRGGRSGPIQSISPVFEANGTAESSAGRSLQTEVIPAILQQIERLRRNGREGDWMSMSLPLQDGENLVLRLRMRGESVDVRFAASRDDVRESLTNGWNSLIEDAASRGIQLSRPVFESDSTATPERVG